MEKYLIVAHPDDEVIWFNPGDFDKIFIVFGNRTDSLEKSEARKKVIDSHPYKHKIECFDLVESNYHKDKTKIKEYKDNYDDFIYKLKNHLTSGIELWTHNLWGEYGHEDHILVHQGVVELATKYNLPVYCYNGIDKLDIRDTKVVKTNLEDFKKIKQLYLKHGAWTWDNDFIPDHSREYFKHE